MHGTLKGFHGWQLTPVEKQGSKVCQFDSAAAVAVEESQEDQVGDGERCGNEGQMKERGEKSTDSQRPGTTGGGDVE